ncbi:hypothetical protein EK599_08600 [Vibrio sp. T187]|uniref:phage terminase small subunit n=1 Tax=Vibrio TaxID=662 RepID=UPI0010C9456A|nr:MULTISPECIES: phage terminase small subunit [Vibrio]MBW3695753.1 hypothetical protein [Vibrio sp. T187]
MYSILMKRQALTNKPKVVQVEQSNRPLALSKPWEEIQLMLKQDLSYVRTLAGSKEKDPFKESLIEKYRSTVETLLETHQGNYANLDVLWWFFIWHVDLGLLETIHDDFRNAIGAGLEAPHNWKMNGQTAYCGYVFNYSLEAHKANKEYERSYLLNAVQDLQSGELATNAPLKVKMYRLVGDWHYEEGERELACQLYEQVMKLDPDKGGCKTKLKELKEELGYGDTD